jgi:hypothetical protein
MITLTYGKRAKETKRAKGTTTRAASTVTTAAQAATCVIHGTLTGLGKQSGAGTAR